MRFMTLVLVAAILVGGGFWYWTTTPQYAIEEVKNAVKAHDRARFEKYVDTESLASGFVDDLVSRPITEMLGRGTAVKWLVSGMTGLFKPQMVKNVQSDLIAFVETGSMNEQSEEDSLLSLKALDSRLGFFKNSVKSIDKVKVEDNQARVTLLLHNKSYGRDLTIDVDMRKYDGRWRVSRIADMHELLAKLVEMEAANLNAPQKDKISGDEIQSGSEKARI